MLPFKTWSLGQPRRQVAQNKYLIYVRRGLWACWVLASPALVYSLFVPTEPKILVAIAIMFLFTWNVEYSIRKVVYFQIDERGVSLMPADILISEADIIAIGNSDLRSPGARFVRVRLGRPRLLVIWGKAYFFGRSGQLQWMEES